MGVGRKGEVQTWPPGYGGKRPCLPCLRRRRSGVCLSGQADVSFALRMNGSLFRYPESTHPVRVPSAPMLACMGRHAPARRRNSEKEVSERVVAQWLAAVPSQASSCCEATAAGGVSRMDGAPRRVWAVAGGLPSLQIDIGVEGDQVKREERDMFTMKQYINGELVEGAGRVIPVVCPGTGETIGQVNAASPEQAQAALEAARDAFPAWSSLTLEQRGEWINKLVAALTEEQDKLADIMAHETGKFYPMAFGEVAGLPRSLEFFLGQARYNYDETIHDPMERNLFLSVREPLGVVVAYIAWNFPMGNLSMKLGAVLASGCTAVIKPATRTPLSTLYVGEIMQRIGFPAGVINFIAASAHEVSAVLTQEQDPRHAHPDRFIPGRARADPRFCHVHQALFTRAGWQCTRDRDPERGCGDGRSSDHGWQDVQLWPGVREPSARLGAPERA